MLTQSTARGVPAHVKPTAARPRGTHCTRCSDLLAECGPELFPLYAKKLLIRGWPGRMSPVERAYYREHRSAAAQKQAEQRSAHLREVRLQPPNGNTQKVEASKANEDSLDAPAWSGTGGVR